MEHRGHVMKGRVKGQDLGPAACRHEADGKHQQSRLGENGWREDRESDKHSRQEGGVSKAIPDERTESTETKGVTTGPASWMLLTTLAKP